jgi:hypothetical protein
MAEKQGLLNRLIMGSNNMPDFTPDKLPKSRLALYWDVLKNNFFKIFLVNLLLVLFTLPLIAFLIYMHFNREGFGMAINGSGNFGVGYPVITDSQALYSSMLTSVGVFETLGMMLTFLVIAVAMAGCSYVMRRLVWGEGVRVWAHFKEGVKDNVKYFLFATFLMSLPFFVVRFCFIVLPSYALPDWMRVIIQVVSVVFFVFLLIALMYFCTQCVTYKLGFFDLITNSLIFAIGLLPQNILFFALSVLVFVPFIVSPTLLFLTVPCGIILAIFGYANMLLIWTVFNHYAYDKFINDHVEGAKKNRNMYVPSEEEKLRQKLEYIKTRNTIYGPEYAARRLSSIDKGQSITPLSSTFNRSDLAKLAEEKKAMSKEIEEERNTIGKEIKAEEQRLESLLNAEAEKNKKGKKRNKK